MSRDNVVGRQALTLEDLGIRPTPVEEVLPACIDATSSLITRAVRARPHPSPRSLPRDRVIQRDTVYSGRILQRPDFWDRVPGSGVADGWCPMPATFPRGGRGAVAAPARAPLVAHAPTPPGIPPHPGVHHPLRHPRAYFAWSAFTFSASVMNSSFGRDGKLVIAYAVGDGSIQLSRSPRRTIHLRVMRSTDSSSVRAPSPTVGTHARACDSSLTLNRSSSA